MKLDIEIEIKNVLKKFDNLDKKILPKTISMALNKSATFAKTQAKREVAEKTSIKQKDIAPKITIKKATTTSLISVLTPSTQPFRLAYFKHTTRLRSLKLEGVRVKAWKQQKVYKGSFVGQMKTRQKGATGSSAIGEAIFTRTAGRMPSNPKKQKIRQLYGPRISDIFKNDKEFTAFMDAKIKQRFKVEFERAINFKLK